MRTTIDIPDDLCQQAESQAARDGIPVDCLVAEALRLALGERLPASRRRVSFPLHHSARPGTLTIERIQAAEKAVAQEEDAARAGAL